MDFIVPLAVMNIVNLFILVLIVLLKKYVAAYGEYNIVVNGEKKYTVPGGEVLSKLLFERKIYIPSACGGRGTCGFCKVRITGGAGDPLPVEEMLLNYRDIRDGYRLSCQTKVRSDMQIEVPEELLSIREYRGKIKDTRKLTKDIKRITIAIEEPREGISFRSGQYVLIKVGENETRAYSIASSVKLQDNIGLDGKLIQGGLA